MYDPAELLATIDAHRWPLLITCGLAMIANYVWFIAAFRRARRERVYSIPLFCTFYWLAHDSSLVYRFEKWFVQYDSWFMELFWVAFLATVAFEIAFVVQDIVLARAELLPTWSRRAFTVAMIGTALVSAVIWENVKFIFDDDLYLLGFGLTIASYPVCAVSLLLRRRSVAGQDVVMWSGFTAMSACYFVGTSVWLTDAFRSVQWILLGVVCTVAGVAMTILVARLRSGVSVWGIAPAPTATASTSDPGRVMAPAGGAP
ncbi:hypothetical protein [Actinomycetospora sp. TBRC 11914]|uniref:hypothetical protein n=1 Tax=Actinomycetospora sp. TBRC 11914 TaxID=2729387 RepID=UPI00145C4CCD|nr:hypothetical protein [Actinomycetospora sp. TBRC 11914]NMO91674.1 hypothetical protein [Actinomycetospora sp. TBRC 11914]